MGKATAHPPICLIALDHPRLELNGQPIRETPASKGLALLTYLALTGGRQPRTHLAGLLWGDLDETLARTNVRVALHKLRKDLPAALEADTQDVVLTPDFGTDVAEFERLADSDTFEGLHAAEALYRGDLLNGIEVAGAPEFEMWLSAERERLRELARRVSYSLSLLTSGAAAQAHAARALSFVPWDEAAHLRIIRLRHAAGDHTAALAQFEQLRETLGRELGVQPSADAQALAHEIDQIRQRRSGSIQSLPQPATPFVGRAHELSAIQTLFDKNARLVTLVGQGGIGKSRLAIAAAAQRQPHYHDGVAFVPLVGVTPAHDAEAGELVLANLAAALGLSFSPALNSDVAPLEQLLAHVRLRHALIVLDNFEQVRGASALLDRILETAPDVHMLVTSRERLGLAAEHVIDVAGLDCSAAAGPSDAHHLFVDVARRVLPQFSAAAAHADIDAICNLVEGSPLCLELAANWVRTLSCEEITRRLRQDLSLLDAGRSNWPERHRSMRSVIASSWRMLGADEQRIFRRLSVFQGGFDAQAALLVAQAPVSVLASLVDKSWLKPDGAGRFRIHELLRQHGAHTLEAQPDERAATEQSHAAYFQDALRAALSLGQVRERGALAGDRDNLRAAWQWHLRAGVESITDFLPDLLRFYDSTGSYQDSVVALQGALALTDSPPGLRTQWKRELGEAHYQVGAAKLGRLTIEAALAECDVRIGASPAGWGWMFARALARQAGHRIAPALARPKSGAPHARMRQACAALRQLMHIYYFRGDEIPLAALIFTYLNTAERIRVPDDMAFGYAAASIAFSAIAQHGIGDYYDRLARKCVQRATDPMLTARALQVIGVYNFGAGRITQARPYIERSLDLYVKNGGYRFHAESEEMMCEMAFYAGNYAESLRLAGVTPLHSTFDPLAIAMSAFTRAACAVRMGEDPSSCRAEMLALNLEALETNDLACIYGALANLHAHPRASARNLALARQFTQRAIESVRKTKMPAIYTLEGYGMLADALMDLCEAGPELDPALRHDTEFVCDTLRKICKVYPLARARAALADGRFASITGDQSARSHFEQARAVAAEYNMPWERAMAEHGLADHGAQTAIRAVQ